MARRENTFRVDYSQFPKLLSHDEIHKFIGKELGLTRENVLQLQPSRRLGCTFVKVINLELAESIVEQHDNKHDFVFDGKSYKLRIMMEDGAVEVQLFDLPEGVTNGQIADFLAEYGEVISIRDLLWDDRYNDFGGVKTGVRVARMVVTKNIPSLVTIQGEETAVGYKGQRQTCLHCHEFAHIGIPCVQNKKLLVQKFAADTLSYASVTKSSSNKPTQIKPNPTNLGRASSTLKSRQNSLTTNLIGTNESRNEATQKKNTMPPPTAPTITQAVSHTSVSIPIGSVVSQRNTDGNETDSSQISQASYGSRRSRRQPPGKKMKHCEETTVSTDQNHAQTPDEDML